MIHIRPIKLRTWFPPGDPVARAIAMLCILREDFILELFGITNDRIEKLDDNDSAHRRMYFWRNSLRTLEEIKDVMNRLNAQERFREAMAKESAEVREAFEALKKELNRASEDFLRELRNTLGGHLDEPTIQAALDEMDPRREALIQVGDILGKTHYKFTTEILLLALVGGVADEQQEFEALLQKSASLMKAVSAIDNVVLCYLKVSPRVSPTRGNRISASPGARPSIRNPEARAGA